MLWLAGLLAIFLLPIALGQSFWLRDIVRFTYPQREYLRAQLLSGHLPLWNPHLGLGRPFLGLVEPGALYPGNLLLLLPVPLGLDLFMAAHLLVAAFGMRAWLKRLGTEEIEAITGGALFALSGYLVSMLAGNGVYLFGVAWVPFILAALAPEALSWRARLGQAARVALLLALCFSTGDPQAVYFAALLAGAQALAAGSRRQILSQLGTLALALSLAGVVALAQLLPGLEVARVGRPGGVPLADAHHFALHPARLLELAWPGTFGAPYSPGWFVHALVDEGTGQLYQPLAAGIYLGLVTPWLALLQIVSRKRRRIDLALGALALVSLGIAIGEHAPLFDPFFRFVPGAHLFRYPSKYLFLTTLCLTALGARGIARVAEHPKRALRIGAALLGLYATGALVASREGPALMVALVGRLGAVSPAAAGQVARGCALTALAIALASLLPIALAALGRLSPERLRLALSLVLVVDLFAASTHLVLWTPRATYRARSPIAADLAALGYDANGPDRLYRPYDLELAGESSHPELARLTLQPNCGTDEGVNHLDAYDVFKPPVEAKLLSGLRSFPLRLLQVTATRFALLSDGELGRAHPGLTIAHHYPRLGASLVEVADAAPRVYLAEESRPVANEKDALAALSAPDFRPGHSATVTDGQARRATGSCVLTRYLPESIALTCRAKAPAYAIVSDGIFPGWRASVNDAPAPILAANLAMRAVPIPAGLSAVEMRYAPAHLRFGFWASGVGLALTLLLALLFRKRKTDA